MALESATYIDGLVKENPTGSDSISEGDDHIRLIKKVILDTFPNITGIVTATQTTLNTIGTGVPSGGIILWSGTIAEVAALNPDWYLCDGNNGTRDLTDRFIIHADADSGGTRNVGDDDGANTVAPVGTLGNVGTHSLSTAQLAVHSHTSSLVTGTTLVGGATTGLASTSDNVGLHSFSGGGAGGGSTHTHVGSTFTGTAVTDNNMPLFYALAYIMKS